MTKMNPQKNLFYFNKTHYLLSNEENLWLKRLEAIVTREMCSGRLSVSFAAHEMNVSERHLCRKLKSILGVSPNKFIRIMRLQEAHALTQDPVMENVQSVAHRVGYKRLDYFSDLYEKYYGFTPLESISQNSCQLV